VTPTIAYLQVGPPEHGISRYGRLLAAEARTRPGTAVLEQAISLESLRDSDERRLLSDTLRQLSTADLIHIQVSLYGETTWGRAWQSLPRLRMFHRMCRAPIIVTLHDANRLEALGSRSLHFSVAVASLEIAKNIVRPLVRRHQAPGLRSVWDIDWLSPLFIAHWVFRHARRVVVFSAAEEAAVRRMYDAVNLRRIPHFIERPSLSLRHPHRDPGAIRLLIVPGFIFRGKGHDLLIEAMPSLPDVEVVFVGGPSLGESGSQESRRLLELARSRGVGHRLRVTGYLPEPAYQQYLAAADLAVCPYDPGKSASGSLSSLISAGCPILASDIPLIAEYNALAPGAIHTFTPQTPTALALAIRKLLDAPRGKLAQGLAPLADHLSISRIYDRHLDVYLEAIGRPGLPVV